MKPHGKLNPYVHYAEQQAYVLTDSFSTDAGAPVLVWNRVSVLLSALAVNWLS